MELENKCEKKLVAIWLGTSDYIREGKPTKKEMIQMGEELRCAKSCEKLGLTAEETLSALISVKPEMIMLL